MTELRSTAARQHLTKKERAALRALGRAIANLPDAELVKFTKALLKGKKHGKA